MDERLDDQEPLDNERFLEWVEDLVNEDKVLSRKQRERLREFISHGDLRAKAVIRVSNEHTDRLIEELDRRVDPKALIERAKNGDEKAFNTLWHHFRPLVRRISATFTKNSTLLEDLVGEGNKVFGAAINSFKPEYVFHAYLTRLLRLRLGGAIYAYTPGIHLPEAVRRRMRLITEMQEAFLAEHDHRPTTAEIVEVTGFSANQVEEAVALIRQGPVLSLDASVGESGEVSAVESVAADDRYEPENVLADNQLRSRLLEQLKSLNPADEDIIKRHFGIDQLPESFARMASNLKISKTTASRRLDAAMEILRSIADDDLRNFLEP